MIMPVDVVAYNLSLALPEGLRPIPFENLRGAQGKPKIKMCGVRDQNKTCGEGVIKKIKHVGRESAEICGEGSAKKIKMCGEGSAKFSPSPPSGFQME